MNQKVYHSSRLIHKGLIAHEAIQVLQTLQSKKHEAFLVGGCVRDLLLQKKPKDFDISTSATPQEIKKIFSKQCILIGRRFRLAHIHFEKKVLEVATFRSGNDDPTFIVRDNQWGSKEEDALRRDFTINGLFYDPLQEIIIDYVGGMKDIEHKMLRTIGDPFIRFQQDPVRMIRLLKFQSRFNLSIDKTSYQALLAQLTEIRKSSPVRILEEIFRMLESGYAYSFFSLLEKTGLFDILFPTLKPFISSRKKPNIHNLLQQIDHMILHHPHMHLDRSILIACVLYPPICTSHTTDILSNLYYQEIHHVIADSIKKLLISSSFIKFPKKILIKATFILTAFFFYFSPNKKRKRRHTAFSKSKYFSLAFSFLKILALQDQEIFSTYKKWQSKPQQSTAQKKHRKKITS